MLWRFRLVKHVLKGKVRKFGLRIPLDEHYPYNQQLQRLRKLLKYGAEDQGRQKVSKGIIFMKFQETTKYLIRLLFQIEQKKYHNDEHEHIELIPQALSFSLHAFTLHRSPYSTNIRVNHSCRIIYIFSTNIYFSLQKDKGFVCIQTRKRQQTLNVFCSLYIVSWTFSFFVLQAKILPSLLVFPLHCFRSVLHDQMRTMFSLLLLNVTRF